MMVTSVTVKVVIIRTWRLLATSCWNSVNPTRRYDGTSLLKSLVILNDRSMLVSLF